MTQVTVTTVTFNDYASNSDKMYRTFVGGNYEVRNWGRIGVIGQFSIKVHSAPYEAAESASKQIAAKQAKGYTHTPKVIETFEFPIDKLEGKGNEGGRLLAHAYDATLLPGSKIAQGGGTPGYPPFLGQDPTPGTTNVIQSDRFTTLIDRSLVAITLSVTNPGKAIEEYVLLQHQLEELMESVDKATSYMETLGEMVTK